MNLNWYRRIARAWSSYFLLKGYIVIWLKKYFFNVCGNAIKFIATIDVFARSLWSLSTSAITRPRSYHSLRLCQLLFDSLTQDIVENWMIWPLLIKIPIKHRWQQLAAAVKAVDNLWHLSKRWQLVELLIWLRQSTPGFVVPLAMFD